MRDNTRDNLWFYGRYDCLYLGDCVFPSLQKRSRQLQISHSATISEEGCGGDLSERVEDEAALTLVGSVYYRAPTVTPALVSIRDKAVKTGNDRTLTSMAAALHDGSALLGGVGADNLSISHLQAMTILDNLRAGVLTKRSAAANSKSVAFYADDDSDYEDAQESEVITCCIFSSITCSLVS